MYFMIMFAVSYIVGLGYLHLDNQIVAVVATQLVPILLNGICILIFITIIHYSNNKEED